MAWAARDKNKTLMLFEHRPHRGNKVWFISDGGGGYWHKGLGPDPLPELGWEEEPVEVEIIVRRKA